MQFRGCGNGSSQLRLWLWCTRLRRAPEAWQRVCGSGRAACAHGPRVQGQRAHRPCAGV